MYKDLANMHSYTIYLHKSSGFFIYSTQSKLVDTPYLEAYFVITAVYHC